MDGAGNTAAAIATARTLLDAPTTVASPVIDALFRGEVSVPIEEADRRLGRVACDALRVLGLVRESESRIVATARLTRFGGLLIASDRVGFRRHQGFVLGPGPATTSLASVVRPIARGTVLDLGCGPGSLALWLAGGGADALGIDISDRALDFAAFNRRLNAQPRLTLRRGDFLTKPPDPSLDEQFDVCVANPPFVIAQRAELSYRDSPLPSDDTTRVALERVARALTPTGRGYVIGTWADDGRGSWAARPRAWLRALGARAIVTRISSVNPSAYASAWTRDVDEAIRPSAIAEWSRWLEAAELRRITTGVVAIAWPRKRLWRRSVVEAVGAARPGWRAIERFLAGG
jgi:SAM-dependent methyltransferase